MNKDSTFYQRKIRQLHQQNDQLKYSLSNSRRREFASPQSTFQIRMKNERLEREAKKYQEKIKRDLSLYIIDSSLQRQCVYRNRYTHLLNSRKNHYRTYF